jgi:hypothetical protein
VEQQLKPGPIITIVGGVVLIVATFLDWGPSVSGLETDVFGLLGILTLIIGLATAVNAGLDSFAPQIERPAGFVGLSRNQISVALGFSAFIWLFGFQFLDGVEFGVTLGWIGALAVVVGGTLADRQGAPSSSGPDQPTQF